VSEIKPKLKIVKKKFVQYGQNGLKENVVSPVEMELSLLQGAVYKELVLEIKPKLKIVKKKFAQFGHNG